MANKKLSLTRLDKIIKSKQSPATSTIKYEIDGEPYDIEVNRYINLEELRGMVNGIVNGVFFLLDDGTEEYMPELLEYVKALHYISYFTNIKVDLGIDRIFSMLYSTDVMQDIYEAIDVIQYQNIENAIENSISHRLAMIEAGEREKIAAATEQIEKAANAFKTLNDQFSVIGEDKFKLLIDRLSGLDEKAIIKVISDTKDKA